MGRLEVSKCSAAPGWKAEVARTAVGAGGAARGTESAGWGSEWVEVWPSSCTRPQVTLLPSCNEASCCCCCCCTDFCCCCLGGWCSSICAWCAASVPGEVPQRHTQGGGAWLEARQPQQEGRSRHMRQDLPVVRSQAAGHEQGPVPQDVPPTIASGPPAIQDAGCHSWRPAWPG